jgi:hypothetical protein
MYRFINKEGMRDSMTALINFDVNHSLVGVAYKNIVVKLIIVP